MTLDFCWACESLDASVVPMFNLTDCQSPSKNDFGKMHSVEEQ